MQILPSVLNTDYGIMNIHWLSSIMNIYYLSGNYLCNLPYVEELVMAQQWWNYVTLHITMLIPVERIFAGASYM